MARPNPSSLTAEGLYRLPDDKLKHELVRGRLVSQPPPGFRHGRVVMNVAFELKSFTRDHGKGVVVTCDTGFILSRNPDTVRGPDVAFVSNERLEVLADDRRYFPGPPDLAVEVLSPSDRSAAVQEKLADYLEGGVTLVWIVDPARQEIQVCRPLERQVLGMDDVLTAPDLLPGFHLPVIDIFGRAPLSKRHLHD